jgi:hypothetical protein
MSTGIALREAARDARRFHKAIDNPMATWIDGQMVWIHTAEHESSASGMRFASPLELSRPAGDRDGPLDIADVPGLTLSPTGVWLS